MSWDALYFLTRPAFVVSWYAIGIAAAVWVVYDVRVDNKALNKPLKWAWPIIMVFFSVIGIVLYFTAARPRGIGAKPAKQQQQILNRYAENGFRKATAAAIHCVGGDGLGIVTAMVIARLAGFTFWLEFWFEYLVGFVFGWLIFQRASMQMMASSTASALWLAFRAEFFSMLTVMGGMGVVMAAVTPLAVGEQPKPWTFGFWSFAALGLIVGMIATYPMNWMMIELGWKHGLGHPQKASA